ncbi:MAG: alpha/beta hydrolase, partial [Anaerolineae bacterium]|nr:alpha/beta hydrolase [Anaerolineae bacterium]
VPALEAGEGLPLVIIPDIAESAEDYQELLLALAPRPCFALSLRGRGQSGSPMQGYALEDHVHDIEALVNMLALPRFALFCYGRGVAYGLAFAALYNEQVAGLIVGDHPALHPAVEPDWVEDTLDATWRGMPVSARLMRHVAEGLQRDGKAVPLWEVLDLITCPTLIMYGAQPGAGLALEDVERYLELLPDARTVRFEDSAHELWEPDPGRFIVTVGNFLQRLDSES